MALFICGLLLYTNEKTSLSDLKPEKSLFICTLSDYPEEKENSFRMVVKLHTKIERSTYVPLNGSILIYNKKDINPLSFLPGDMMILRCTPVEIENRGNPYEFDYKFFMENQHIRYTAFTNGKDIVRHISPPHRKLTYRALITREKIIQMFRDRGIKGERLALVAAITLGQKSMLEPEQRMNFIKAGVMHIMAVSGLHAIIISLFVLSLLFFMKHKFNILRILIAIAVLWSFAFVTGLTPSVLRATLMFTFLQAGKIMKRPSDGTNSVLASAVCLILISPSVIFNAGFLLSYSAVIYIISFYRDFYLILHVRNWLADKIWQSTAVTIVAQAGTLPLTMSLFNRFPVYFLIANITIVPVTNLLIIIGCLVPLFFPVQFLSHFLAVLLNYLTGITEAMTSRTAALPYSTIENIGLAVPECILLTCAIFLFSFSLLKKKSIRSVYPLIFVGLFVFAGTARDITTKRSNELVIYNTPGLSNIGVRTGKILNLYSDSATVAGDVNKHCATLGLKIEPRVLNNGFHLIRSEHKRILITNTLHNDALKDLNPDIIILSSREPVIERDFHPGKSCCAIVVTSGVRSGFLPLYDVDTASCKIHYVKKSGAFVRRI
jgi:competence protein ComEC